MPETAMQAFNLPSAWKATDYQAKDAFAIDLEPRHIQALNAEVACFKATGGGHEDMNTKTFPLYEIADDIANWRDEVHTGRGMILLRGVPVENIDLDDPRLLYLGLGSHFGRPISQSNMGELVGEVVNIGDKDRRTGLPQQPRIDAAHGLRRPHRHAVHPSRHQGGLSGYASALNIHNIMLEERPDLLAHLYNGFHHHRFGEQPPGEPVVTRERIPIFSITDGVPSVIFIRGYINAAVDEGHVSLLDGELEALNYMEAVSNRPDVRLNFLMEPGDLLFVNNCLILHTRTEFEDSDDPAKRRHLMRLWLREDNRPAAEGVIIHKGKAGIEKQEGKGTYYNNDAVETAFEVRAPSIGSP